MFAHWSAHWPPSCISWLRKRFPSFPRVLFSHFSLPSHWAFSPLSVFSQHFLNLPSFFSPPHPGSLPPEFPQIPPIPLSPLSRVSLFSQYSLNSSSFPSLLSRGFLSFLSVLSILPQLPLPSVQGFSLFGVLLILPHSSLIFLFLPSRVSLLSFLSNSSSFFPHPSPLLDFTSIFSYSPFFALSFILRR